MRHQFYGQRHHDLHDDRAYDLRTCAFLAFPSMPQGKRQSGTFLLCVSPKRLSEKGIGGLNMSGRVPKDAPGFANIVTLMSLWRGGKGTFQTDSKLLLALGHAYDAYNPAHPVNPVETCA